MSVHDVMVLVGMDLIYKIVISIKNVLNKTVQSIITKIYVHVCGIYKLI